MGSPIVLGLNAAHDAAACLLRDGEVVVAVSEERLSRRKHQRGYPARAVDYCLRYAGLSDISAVSSIVLNQDPRDDCEPPIRRSGFTGEVIINPSHHLLHAYYARIASGFDRPAVLVVDGSGFSYGEHQRHGSPLIGAAPPYSEMEESESMYVVGSDGQLQLVRKKWGLWEAIEPFTRFPSLGHMFSAASEYIFGHFQHAGKTMGLAAYGDAAAFPEPFIEYQGDDLAIDTTWVTRLPPRSAEPAQLDPVCRNLAAKVQQELERAIVHLCDVLHRATGATDLALSGGVGLNSVANGLILERTPFARLFVTPAAGDSGVAIGAALYGHHRLTSDLPDWKTPHNYHGQPYDETAVADAVAESSRFLRAERVGDAAKAAADDLLAGRIAAWFEGGSEFGPRALGHRSIICDPRPAGMRDVLNERVKFREPFRPYAASVLAEHTREFFGASADDPFMMTVVPVRADRAGLIPNVVHADGTCRIQTVDRDYQGGDYRRLIERFHELTGLPLILNTSFNIRGEPIVETPRDAIRCFLGCDLDALYAEGMRITRIADGPGTSPGDLVPHLAEGTSLHADTGVCDGKAAQTRYCCATRTGYRLTVSPVEYSLLGLVDARRTVAGIAAAAGVSTAEAASAIVSLRQRGLLALAGSPS